MATYDPKMTATEIQEYMIGCGRFEILPRPLTEMYKPPIILCHRQDRTILQPYDNSTLPKYIKLKWNDENVQRALTKNPQQIHKIPPEFRKPEYYDLAITVSRSIISELPDINDQDNYQCKQITYHPMHLHHIPHINKYPLEMILGGHKTFHYRICDIMTSHLTEEMQKEFLEKWWSRESLHPSFDDDEFLKTNFIRKMKVKHGSLDYQMSHPLPWVNPFGGSIF